MSLLDHLQEAAGASEVGCKLCSILAERGDGAEINALLFTKRRDSWKISAEKVVNIMKGDGISVGATTVRTHRNQDHRQLNPEG